jgi:hypothetical protein
MMVTDSEKTFGGCKKKAITLHKIVRRVFAFHKQPARPFAHCIKLDSLIHRELNGPVASSIEPVEYNRALCASIGYSFLK